MGEGQCPVCGFSMLNNSPALMSLSPRQPFDFARTLRFVLSPPALLNGRSFPPLLDYFEEGEYRRLIAVGGQQVLYGVREQWADGRAALGIHFLAGTPDDAGRRAVRAQVEIQFSTGLDLTPFYDLAQSDPVLGLLAERFRGMRIPQAPTVFETVISAILEQQVNLSFAHQVKRALIETYGSSLTFEGRRYNAFPEPGALARATPGDLRQLKISGPKARYLIGVARACQDGRLDLEGLSRLDPATARARLLEEKGVGPWTAQYVGLRALGHRDCLPAADVGLRKVVRELYGLRRLPSAERVEKLAQRWAGWRSYATFYLWLTYWEDKEWKAAFVDSLRAFERRKLR